MADVRNFHWQRLEGPLGQMAYALTHIQMARFRPTASWAPAINAYRCRSAVHIFVDLAGVARSEIELTVEPHRLVLRGNRRPPEPDPRTQEALQVLALEIDHGPFERELVFRAEVDPERA